MRTLRGLLRTSLSRKSAESSQIFCKAPKAPFLEEKWKMRRVNLKIFGTWQVKLQNEPLRVQAFQKGWEQQTLDLTGFSQTIKE